MRQNRHSTKTYVVYRNTLSDSFRIRIVWFQPKQDSDRIRISFFKNKIGSDSENPLSDHLWCMDRILDFLDPGDAASGRIRIQIFLTRTGFGLDLDFVIFWWRMVWKDVWWYRTWRWREVGDSYQSFSSGTLQGILSEWSGDTTELVYIQKRRDLIV